MSDRQKPHGCWDEPIPGNIASGLKETEGATNGEFNPAFGKTPRRESPVVKTPIESSITSELDDPAIFSKRDRNGRAQESAEQASKLDRAAASDSGAEIPNVSTGAQADINALNDRQDSPVKKKKALLGNTEKFTKPKLIRASVKTVIPHIVLVIVCAIIALFPATVIGLLGEEVKEFPDYIVKGLPIGTTAFFTLLALMILVTMFRNLATGSLWLYDGYLKFRIGVIGNEMHAYENLQKVDVQRTLSSLWSDTGDLIILHPKGSMTLRNIYAPFDIKEMLEKKIEHYKNNGL